MFASGASQGLGEDADDCLASSLSCQWRRTAITKQPPPCAGQFLAERLRLVSRHQKIRFDILEDCQILSTTMLHIALE